MLSLCSPLTLATESVIPAGGMLRRAFLKLATGLSGSRPKHRFDPAKYQGEWVWQNVDPAPRFEIRNGQFHRVYPQIGSKPSLFYKNAT